MLAPFVLRRLKSGVLKQLVAKTERVEMVPLSEVRECDCLISNVCRLEHYLGSGRKMARLR